MAKQLTTLRYARVAKRRKLYRGLGGWNPPISRRRRRRDEERDRRGLPTRDLNTGSSLSSGARSRCLGVAMPSGVLPLSGVRRVDPIERLRAMREEWAQAPLELVGLDEVRAASPHPLAARRRAAVS